MLPSRPQSSGPPVDPKDAVKAICKLAKARRIRIARVAQSGMDRLGHDYEYVMECLEECSIGELESAFPANVPGEWFFQFIVKLVDDPDIYVKLAIRVPQLDRAELVSYKPDGSPE